MSGTISPGPTHLISKVASYLRLPEEARRRPRISDLDALMRAAMFNPDRLYLDPEGRGLDAND